MGIKDESYKQTIKEFVSLMNEYSSSGFHSWDGADNYDVSEDIMGAHKICA